MTTSLPSRNALEARISDQQARLYQAIAVCGSVALAAKQAALHTDGWLSGANTCDLYMALEGARETLDSIAEAFDSNHLLDATLTPQEIEAAAETAEVQS